jgi:hypothetical protein
MFENTSRPGRDIRAEFGDLLSGTRRRLGRAILSGSGFTTAVVFCGIAMAGSGPSQAANLQALEANSGQCGTQGVCFVPDGFTFFDSTYDAASDTVTGIGSFSSSAPASGTQAVYITAGDGLTVIDILNLTFTNSGGTTENVTASWQASNGADLGAVPFGGTSIIGNGNLQDLTTLLSGQGGFPLDIAVQARDVPVPAPEPISIALLGAGLVGLGVIRRRRQG